MIHDHFVIGHAGRKIPIPHQPVDQVGAEERAAFFSKRSIKKQTKLDALYAIVSMIDLTTLEGADTPGRVRQMCAKARFPLPPSVDRELSSHPQARPMPSVAAVCVYPAMVPHAVKALASTGSPAMAWSGAAAHSAVLPRTKIHIASVATAFPAGQLPLSIKLADVQAAIDFGADEIDMVINRGAFLSGDYQRVFDEIVQVKEACGEAHLKVILETGELSTYDRVQLASHLAMLAGADFIKTSTGQLSPAATLPVTLVMLNAIKDYHRASGIKVGMKPAGGIRDAKMAIQYLCMVQEVLGPEWLTPDLFRLGASRLLNDVLKQIYKQVSGHYYYDKIFSMD